MKNIIATWVCVDPEENGTWFPSVKGRSSDTKVQEIYWKCVTCFFATARYFNPDAELVFFSNCKTLPTIGVHAVSDILEKWNVRFYSTPFEYITPKGYFDKWRNQFYEFSIFSFISNHPDFDKEDNFLLLDSDCIINTNLSGLFRSVREHSCITYIIDYAPDHLINGNSRKDMQKIFGELSGQVPDRWPYYHAGEFYASTIHVVRLVVQDFYATWQQLMERYQAGMPVLHEEAHVLSYLFYLQHFPGGQANRYIKRLWTDPSSYRNVEKTDADLPIWHLPAEKRFGFCRMFDWLQSESFDLSDVSAANLSRRLRTNFLIPFIPLGRKPFYFTKKLLKKMMPQP